MLLKNYIEERCMGAADVSIVLQVAKQGGYAK